MATGFEAVREDIDQSAEAMSAVASGVKSADPSDDVQSIGSALPGSESAAAASALVGTWTQRFKAWSDDAESHAEARRTSAANYTHADYEAANQFSLTGPPGVR